MSDDEFMTANDLDLSLNYFLRNGFQPHPHFYNCTGVDGFLIGEKRPFIGTYFFVTGIIIWIIYIPCLIVISKSDMMKSSCYKIMFYLGIMDICCISCNSLATGYLGIIGATFCSYPRFIFVMGAIGCGCWLGSCCTCILLAINRCCDVNPQLRIRSVFIGKNIYAAIMVPLIYTLYAIFFTKPFVFNSAFMTWFFNPMLPNMNSEDYINIAHSINNVAVSITTTVLYSYLCILLAHKSRHAQTDAISKTQRQVFIQSVMICAFNAVSAYIYVYMQFFDSPPAILMLGSLAWQCSNGSVCIVYITMNRTVRRGVIDLFVPDFIQNKTKLGTNRTFTTTRMISNVRMIDPKNGKQSIPQTATSSGAVF